MSLLFLSLKVVTGFIKSGFIINSLSNSTVCGSAVKNLPANAGVWTLGQENPLKKETTTHFSITAWEIPQREKPGELQSTGFKKSQTRLRD